MDSRILRYLCLPIMVSVHMTAVAAESLNKSDLSSTVDQLAASYIDPQNPGCAIGVIHNAEYVHKGIARLGNNAKSCNKLNCQL